MKVENVDEKTVEFFRKNGRRIVCTGLLAGSIMIPFDESIMEEHDDRIITQPPKQTQVINNNEALATMSEEDISDYLTKHAYKGEDGNVVQYKDAQNEDNPKLNVELFMGGGKNISFELDVSNPNTIMEQAQQVLDREITEEDYAKMNDMGIQYGSFTIKSNWRKSSNSSDEKEVANYHREVMQLRLRESYNFEDFAKIYPKIINYLGSDLKSMFQSSEMNEMFDYLGYSIESTTAKENEIDTNNVEVVAGGLLDINVSVVDKKPKDNSTAVYITAGIFFALGTFIAIYGHVKDKREEEARIVTSGLAGRDVYGRGL